MCLHLFLSLTSSLAVPMTLCLGLLGSGLAGSEREVVVNMLNSLSRNQPLPQITPRCGCVDPLPGRLPFQGYESACSGRHYCLRGMDYSVSGPPCTERRLRPLCTELPTVRFAGPRRRRAPPQTSPAPRAQPYPAPPPLRAWHPAPLLALPGVCVRPHSASSPRGPLTGRLPVPSSGLMA